jgi:hypothetical protein
MHTESHTAEGEATRSPLTPIEKSRIEHQAVHAAAIKGGEVDPLIRGILSTRNEHVMCF